MINVDNGKLYTKILSSVLSSLVIPENILNMMAEPDIDDYSKITNKDCSTRYLTKKYRLNTGDGGTTTINHNWYSTYYDLTIDWWNLSVGKSNSIINKRTQDYIKSMSANEKNWFRFFEMEIERAALDDNQKKYKELQN